MGKVSLFSVETVLNKFCISNLCESETETSRDEFFIGLVFNVNFLLRDYFSEDQNGRLLIYVGP